MPTGKELVISIVISFLVVVLVCSSSGIADVYARPKVVSKGSIDCVGKGDAGSPAKQIACCQDWKYSDGLEVTYCTACDNTDPPSNCGPRYILNQGPSNPPPPPPPTNVLPP